MKFLAAAIQMLALDDKAANLEEAERWIRHAASDGARVVALPEVFIWRGSKKIERASAEPIPGPTTMRLADLARELGIYLLGGSILEDIPDSKKVYNTSVLFGPRGVLAIYRKIHLFDVDLANGVCRKSALGDFAPRSRNRKSGLYGCSGPVRRESSKLRNPWTFNDCRSMGKNFGRGSRRSGNSDGRGRPRLSRERTRRTPCTHTPKADLSRYISKFHHRMLLITVVQQHWLRSQDCYT